MLVLAFFVMLAVSTSTSGSGEDGFEFSCGTISAARLSVQPAGEPGRYRVQYCRRAPASRDPLDPWQCELSLKVHDQPRENCTYNRLAEKANGRLHSQKFVDFTPDKTCSHVCLSQNMDLLFRGCYSVHVMCKVGRYSSEPYSSYHYINNDLTLEYFHNTTHWYKPYEHETMVSFIWQTNIPITDYEIFLCKYYNDTHETAGAAGCSLATRNCSRPTAHRLACRLRAPRGCHLLFLQHRAPWVSGIFADRARVHADFCYDGGPEAALVSGGARAARWAWAGAALACAAAVAVLLRRSRVDAELKKRVLEHWRAGVAGAGASAADCATPEPEPALQAVPDGVLLLHARDCAAVERFARALAGLLRDQLGVKVWDIYSPEVVCMSGAAPAAWLRAALAAPRLPVLLLQTPALRLLAPLAPPAPPATPAARVILAPVPTVEHFMSPLSYCLLADLCNHTWVLECARDFRSPNLTRTFRDECDMLEYNCDYDRVEAPLLARRVVHRAPHCADALLPLALRALADAPPPADAYRKYYLATVNSLEAEALRTVVPYRRYALPAAAGALLRDLATRAPAAPPALREPPAHCPALRELHAAHEALLQYVRLNPDYLEQELMFL